MADVDFVTEWCRLLLPQLWGSSTTPRETSLTMMLQVSICQALIDGFMSNSMLFICVFGAPTGHF